MIYFCFLSNNQIGGVQDLFLEIIKTLCSSNYSVGLIDRRNGSLSARVTTKHVKIVYIEDLPNLGQDSLVITNSLSRDLLRVLSKNQSAKILFYNLFPEGLKRVNCIRGHKVPWLTNNYTKRLALSLLSKNSLIFMSESAIKHFNLPENTEVKSDENLVPVMFREEIRYQFSNCKGIVSVGRADEWKQKIFRDFLEFLVTIKFRDCITVVTDDPCKLKSIYGHRILKNLNIRILGPYKPEELTMRVVGSGRLGFAMGLSALHLIAAGVPTIILDATFENSTISNYRFEFLNQKPNYELGDVITYSTFTKGYTLDELYSLYRDATALEQQWQLDSEALDKQYSKANVIAKLLTKIEQAEATFLDIKSDIFWL